MSYARFGYDSDVYVFLSVSGHLECCACRLASTTQIFASTDAMLAHLSAHADLGDRVPADTISDLKHDRDSNDSFIADARKERIRMSVAPECACGHLTGDHVFADAGLRAPHIGPCLIPGCGCPKFKDREESDDD